MKYNYKFSSIIGSSYQNGNVCFTPDSNTVLSPVGNNISLLHLKRDDIKTIEVNSSFNIEHVAMSPKEPILMCINEEGYANVVSMITGHVINNHFFRHKVNCISYSPNGNMFAVGRGKLVLVYYAPSIDKPLMQFRLQRSYDGASADVTSIDWSSDSKAFVVGSADNSTRVYAAFKTDKLVLYSLGGNNGNVVKCAFMRDSLNVLSVSKNAQLCYWTCNKSLDFLSLEKNEEEQSECAESKKKKNKNVITYLRAKNFFYRNIETDKQLQIEVTAADFHHQLNLLVTGFVDGRIMIHEMPDFSPRFYLPVCGGQIDSISFNGLGSWIAIGSLGDNELNVFCWRSQSFIFQTKGHKRSSINCLDYSPDGNWLATGGQDGFVKIWDLSNGRCFATFPGHIGPVSGVCFPRKKVQTIFSSSLDGSVKGFDVSRLKNFCVLTPGERAYQLTCVSASDNGELVAAGGGSDCFSVMVWMVQTRELVFTLSGHEQPVCSLMFSSIAGGNHLVSGSWDQSMRIWQLTNGESKEVMNTNSDVLAVAFRPDGTEIAGALLNGNIIFFDSMTGEQLKEIEGKHDLGLSKHEGELITAKKASEEKLFQAICYSADGRFLLAAGNSKYICLYNVDQQLLVKRFQISCNLSMEGVLDVLDRRRITQWGFSDVHIDMSNKRALPGVSRDVSSKRQVKIEAFVSSIKFSPTGTNFAAATSEGVMIFSNEKAFRGINYVGGSVDFSQFQMNVTPESVSDMATKRQFSAALNAALKIKKLDLLTDVIESIPADEVQFVIKQLKIDEVGLALCRFLARQLATSTNLGYYAHWIKFVLVEWAETIWKSADLEWKTVFVDIIKSAKLNQSKLSAADTTSNKANWIDAIVQKQTKLESI